GGILVETRGDGAVVGVGLNVNVSPGIAGGTPAAAVAELAGRSVDRTRLLALLLPAVLRAIDARGDAQHGVRATWERWSSVRGRRVRVATRQAQHAGVVEDFGPNGELLLRRDDGLLITLVAGDVTLRA
ncbi:MAG: hypothetical protein FJ029_03325, partial [Actinobacteria bacterium]|nr:hypothetical protein [Actinomycetota bacterium]